MSFVFPTVALLGLALAAAPVLIHLLTRRRRRVVPWGAMEFLLGAATRRTASFRWSQWLLLASRVAVVALAGALLAKPLVPDALAAWFIDRPTTHLVLLDDSYSMTERDATGGAWRRAADAVVRLAEVISNQATLEIRTYRRDGAELHTAANAPSSVRRLLSAAAPEWSADGPIDGLRRLRERAAEASAEGRGVYAYVLSDFRDQDHRRDAAYAVSIEALASEVDGLLLAPCAGPATSNLTLSDLRIDPGPCAAGVEMTVAIDVTNNGPAASAETRVMLYRDGLARATIPVRELAPGESVTQRRAVRFASRGTHTLRAELPEDAVVADNRRWLGLELPETRDIVVIDGSKQGREGAVVAAALRPNGRVATGWRPRLESWAILESIEALTGATAVVVLDPERIGPDSAARLLEFVRGGGGVLLALGPNAVVGPLNETLSQGLAPWRLDRPTQAPWVEPGAAGLVVSDHPAVRVFAGQRNGFLPLVRVAMSHTLAEPVTEGVIASLPNGSPLLLERRLGDGRLVTVLTTAAALGDGDESWTNLAALPAYPVLVHELIGWITQQRLRPTTRLIGDRVVFAELNSLADAGTPRATHVSEDRLELELEEVGAYRGLTAGVTETFAVNVDPRQGDLSAPTAGELEKRFGAIASVIPAKDAFRQNDRRAGSDIAALVACSLLALTVAERLLAYRCSHADGVDAALATTRRAA